MSNDTTGATPLDNFHSDELRAELARRNAITEAAVKTMEASFKTTAVLTRKLRGFYTEVEAFQWLTTPQPQFDGAIPLDMIASGRMEDLVLSLRRMEEGVYL